MGAPHHGLRFSLLGPVRAWRDGDELDVGPPQQRTIMALLLFGAGRPILVADMVDVLWGAAPPASAVNIVQRNVGRLCRLLEPELPARSEGRLIVRTGGGYRLETTADQVDLFVYRQQLSRPNRPRWRARSTDACRCSLRRWRCSRDRRQVAWNRTPMATRYSPPLDGEYLAGVRRTADVALAARLLEAVLPALTRAAHVHPLDESLQARLMLVLAAVGQQALALETYEAVRARLSGELGVDPGVELRAAYAVVLNPGASTGPATPDGESGGCNAAGRPDAGPATAGPGDVHRPPG